MAKWRGKVKSMREDYDDKSKVCIEVEVPAAKKAAAKKGSKDVGPSVAYKPTRSVTVSPEMAASLSLGDAVEVETTVRPYGKSGQGVAAAAAAEAKS